MFTGYYLHSMLLPSSVLSDCLKRVYVQAGSQVVEVTELRTPRRTLPNQFTYTEFLVSTASYIECAQKEIRDNSSEVLLRTGRFKDSDQPMT